MKVWNSCFLLTLVLGSLFQPGCSPSGPELREVTGKVTVDGIPVAGAILTFVPTSGGSPSYGGTDQSGNYRLMFTDTKAGAMLGEHEVEIAVNRMSAAEKAEMKASGQEVNDSVVAIPKKYRKKGALTATVERKANVINFELTKD